MPLGLIVTVAAFIGFFALVGYGAHGWNKEAAAVCKQHGMTRIGVDASANYAPCIDSNGQMFFKRMP